MDKEWIKTRIEQHPGFSELWEPLRSIVIGPARLGWMERVLNRYPIDTVFELLDTIDWMRDQEKIIMRHVVEEFFLSK